MRRNGLKRIAIVAIGSWGDVGPLVTLGAGLVDAGYEVVLVTHAAYADDAGRAGLDFAPLSGDPVAIPEDEDGRQWLESGGNGLRFAAHLIRIARPLLRAVLDEAYAACRSCRAVLHTPFASFAAHVAERLELPSILVGQQPVTRTGAWRAFLVPDGVPLGRLGNRLSYRPDGAGGLAAVPVRLPAVAPRRRAARRRPVRTGRPAVHRPGAGGVRLQQPGGAAAGRLAALAPRRRLLDGAGARFVGARGRPASRRSCGTVRRRCSWGSGA